MNTCIFVGTQAFSVQLSSIHLGRLLQVYMGSFFFLFTAALFLFFFFFNSLEFQIHSPLLDLTQKIRFISSTCANLAVCLCSWGLLTSPAVHHVLLLTHVNSSLHCLHQEVKVSLGSFRGRDSYARMCRQTAHRAVKTCLYLFKADQSFLITNA